MLEGQGNFTYHKLAGQTGLQYPRKKKRLHVTEVIWLHDVYKVRIKKKSKTNTNISRKIYSISLFFFFLILQSDTIYEYKMLA